MSLHLVFVYGTLRSGFRNHSLLQEQRATLRGVAVTEDRFLLARLHQWSDVPILCRPESPEQGVQVRGEVWYVQDGALEQLDRLEQHPHWYCREEVRVQLEGTDQVVTAWVYLMPGQPREDQPLIPSGDYADAVAAMRAVRSY